MTLGLTQPLIEISARNLFGEKIGQGVRLKILTAICEPIF
jgi:hypothetical protein